MRRVLFVCLGNICRSPLAQGAFEAALAARGLGGVFEVDSAGTGGWHAGERPDRRAIAEARRHGVELAGQRARALTPEDLQVFDEIRVMDRQNLRDVQALAARQPPGTVRARVGLLLADAAVGVEEVPDPYYGGPEGFAEVWRLVVAGAEGLLARLSAGAAAGR